MGIDHASIFLDHQTHGAGVQHSCQLVKLLRSRFFPRVQGRGHDLGRGPSGPVKIPTVLKPNSRALTDDQQDHADAENAHNGGHDDRDNDHEDVGPKKTFPDRHIGSSRGKRFVVL